jgi:cyclic pyranopterin monophosphate synthase
LCLSFCRHFGHGFGVKLYQLDEVDDRLLLVPLAARRALDGVGQKVSLAEWQRLPLSFRSHLVALGSASELDGPLIQQVLTQFGVHSTAIEALDEPSPDGVPPTVSEAFGPSRPIPLATWSALGPLDRYALVKIASKATPARLDAAYDEIVGHSSISTHLEPSGGVRMVNVSEKSVTQRVASAESFVTMSSDAFTRLSTADVPKGDVLGVARVAAIQAAKKTADLIPLCHAIQLTKVNVEFELRPATFQLHILVTTTAIDRTGVEMEALTAAGVAALTVYDMLKGVDRSMAIGPLQLVHKSGGRSGDFSREGNS